jgi:hypothetical protein
MRMLKLPQFRPSPPRRAKHVPSRASFPHQLEVWPMAAALPEAERVLARWGWAGVKETV